MNKPSICVLLSAYKGERFIREQVLSLLNQTIKPDKIIVRLDGEDDNSDSAISDIANNEVISVIRGEHLGVTRSFLDLLSTPGHYDYYALSDQDDVWLEDKLERAVSFLNQYGDGRPLLYISSFTPVDSSLHKMNVVIPKIYSYTDFAHSLVYHTGPGCTFVMNYAAKSLVSHIDFKNCFLGLHDSLIHKIVAMCGTVVYDSESRILYRQHNNNLIGFSTGRVENLVNKSKGFINGRLKNYRRNLARTLLSSCIGLFDSHQAQLLRTLAYYDRNLNSKLKLIHTPDFKTGSIYDVVFAFLVLLGKV